MSKAIKFDIQGQRNTIQGKLENVKREFGKEYSSKLKFSFGPQKI